MGAAAIGWVMPIAQPLPVWYRWEAVRARESSQRSAVRPWFAALLVRRLSNAGMWTLGGLMALANALGASWCRRVPRVGIRVKIGHPYTYQ